MENFDIVTELKKRNQVERTIAARYCRYMSDDCGEMWQCIDKNGNTDFISRDVWQHRVWGWHSICDPDGYEERDCHLDEDVHILLCDQHWNIVDYDVAGHPLQNSWEHQIGVQRNYLSKEGITPEPNKENTPGAVVHRMYKAEGETHVDNYIENALWCRWKSHGKPKVIRKFKWMGMKCYVMYSEMIHSYFPILKREYWVMCSEKYYGLPRRFLYQDAVEIPAENYRATYEDLNKRREEIPFKLHVGIDGNHFREKVTIYMDYHQLSAPSVKVYREFCKKAGLRPITSDASGHQYEMRCGFRIAEYRNTSKSDVMPSDFTPYPVMNNGSPRQGGYKVEGNTLIVFRPNPNWYEPIMTWEEYCEWKKYNVAI